MTHVLIPGTNRTAATHRVVITGVGLSTALGLGTRANATGFRHGQTAFRPISLFDTTHQRVSSAAEMDLPGALPDSGLSPRREARLDRSARMLILAGLEAWAQCGWESGSSMPIILGTTSGGMPQGEAYFQQATQHPSRFRGQAGRVMEYLVQSQGAQLAEALEVEGAVTLIANACASGGNAIGHAWNCVRRGRATKVLTGGYDALSQLVFAGFDSLMALSPTSCRPFDASRDGLALGEGAAVLAIESLESARQRDAEILGEIVGYGAASDPHHLTQPQPEGEAALATMSEACRMAGVNPSEVGYVNAHGTGTILNDSAEASAINRWAGSHAPQLRVSSTKASVGHTLGAAGAIEAVICLLALREGWLPPNATTQNPDPLCQFQLLQNPIDLTTSFALSNSFGFGGANASLLFRRWEGDLT